MDDAASDFVAITGANNQVARHFLTMTDGNMEQAIQLFFDSPDLSSAMTSETSAPASTTAVPSRSNASSRRPDNGGVIQIDSDDDGDAPMEFDHNDDPATPPTTTPSRAVPTTYEDDEAIARRMQEELFAGGDMNAGADADGIRAPIARTTETLVGAGADWGGGDDLHEAVLEQMRARARPRTSRPGVFNQQPGSSSIWDESNPLTRRANLAQATGGASEASSKAAKLAELFRPPFELMSRIPWDDARQQGKDEQKWILVNVQDPSIFDCQALNRDVWKHDGIRETVKENFIFMQYAKDDPRGNQYMQYYFPNRDNEALYPHIAIVDPRTGEQVKVWSGPPVPKPLEFMMQLHEFLDRYSLNAAARNPVAKRKAEKPASVDVDRLTEEQMLDLAMQNSLANAATPAPKAHDPDDLTKSIGDISKGKAKDMQAGEDDLDVVEMDTPQENRARSAFSRISSERPHTEPANDPATTTRIQFRHPAGRIIHRFGVSEPVSRLYEWLKAEPLEERARAEFELKAQGKDLIDLLDQTVAEAQLKNGTVMIEFLED